MFGNWFADKTASAALTSERNDQKLSTIGDGGAVAPSVSPAAQSDVVESGTLPITSPRDIAIVGLEGEYRELESAGIPDKSSTPRLRRRREHPENVYDPFDGQSIGLMIPGEFEEREDDIWTHLAEIRNLQSDIARLHAQIERLGDNDRLQGQGEDETVHPEDEAKAAKAAEFTKLTDRFNNRKEAIDAIMQKLQTLSKSVNDFHSSRAPVFRPPGLHSSQDDKQGANRTTTASSQYEGHPEHSAVHDRILSGSIDTDALKDSSESMARNLDGR